MDKAREKEIVKVSIIGIFANFFLAGSKAAVGLIAGSIAIISDSLNNFTDAISSIVTIVGTKIANKKPDKEHPYGHGRVEYIASFIIAAIIMYVGITTLIASFKKIIHPSVVHYSFATVLIIVLAIVIKIFLGLYAKNQGNKHNSESLVASGYDALNDALISISLIITIVIYLVFKVNIEGFIGTGVSIYIVYAGFNLIKSSVDNLLGTTLDRKLVKNIKREILKNKEVNGVFDLILNNYGPDRFIGSVHIELLDKLTVDKVDKLSRDISKTIYDKYGVVLHTIGVYAVNTKDKRIAKVQKDITKIVFSHEGVLEFHGFYFDEDNKTISFDIIIDFKVKNREDLYKHICDEISNEYPDYIINITLDVELDD